MRKSKLLAYGFAVIGVLLIIYAVVGLLENKSTKEEVAQQSFDSIVTGTTGDGDVAVELTPRGLVNERLVVEVGANTHSVDLSQFDLKQLAVLEYKGKTVYPSEAPYLNGHHAYGDLIFDVEGDINEFSIKITNIPNVEKRVYEWR